MTLHVCRPRCGPALVGLVIVGLQPVFPFQCHAKVGKRQMWVIRLVHGVPGRVKLVDGDVDVQVISSTNQSA